jgi:hypothetical protein
MRRDRDADCRPLRRIGNPGAATLSKHRRQYEEQWVADVRDADQRHGRQGERQSERRHDAALIEDV